MDFADQIRALATRAKQQQHLLVTEEATKTAVVMPMLAALGYNVFDPTEVMPEFTADVGTKKGEKVDYAIMQDAHPVMLIECKKAGAELSLNNASQLFRYFGTTSAKIAILTNGIQYRFYTDLDAPNKMDEKPFLDLDLFKLDEPSLAALRKFAKEVLDLDAMVGEAASLKHTHEVKRILAKQMTAPEEEFVKFFITQAYGGRATKAVKEQFTGVVRRALAEFVRDRINERLRVAEDMESQAAQVVAEEEAPKPENEVVTTDEEMEAFRIVRAICAAKVSVERVVMRDTKSYCGVLFDDNNRKPICRLRFEGGQKYVGVMDPDKVEHKHPIDSVYDIYQHAAALETIAVHWAST